MQKLLIDTDAGVDDAIAIAWLLTQSTYPIKVLGISAVAGNATVENVANNVLTLLHTVERAEIPLLVGTTEPLCQPLARTTQFYHGLDGLWGAGASPPYNLNHLSHDVSGFFRQIASEHPGATLLALGPLTNLALAVKQFPQALRQFDQIVILGATKSEGSATPVSEYNFWQDPEAANIVLSADLPITLVPREAFIPFTITLSDLQALKRKETAVLKLLVPPLFRYIDIQNQVGGVAAATLPDLVASLYAVDNSLGTTKPALVKVITGPDLVRGQSIMGYTFQERLPMIASPAELDGLAAQAQSNPDFDLFGTIQAMLERVPANCQVVTNIKVAKMRDLFLSTMIGDGTG